MMMMMLRSTTRMMARPLSVGHTWSSQPGTMRSIDRLVLRHRPQAKITTPSSFESGRKLLEQDRVLLGSMGLVSGGLVVTTLLQTEHGDWKSALQHQYRRDDEDTWGGFFRDSWENLTQSVKRELEDDNTKALAALIAANTAVFGLWRFSMGRPMLERLMWKHFACSYNAVAHGGRVHTLLTSAFSHMTFLHFGINMFMLWEFGRQILAPSSSSKNSWYNSALSNSRIVEMFRSARTSNRPQLLELDKFMALYFGSALASSALSIGVSKFRGTAGVFTIGASGAVMGVFTIYCLLFPERELMLYGLINLTAYEMLQLTTAMNLVGSAFQRNLAVDFTGHLGGQGTGFLLYETKALSS